MALEPKIGEVFELYGRKYKCVKSSLTCINCNLDRNYCRIIDCTKEWRTDHKNVIFKLLPNKQNNKD